jgi:putative membrane-bound dehydrogenase-like protein
MYAGFESPIPANNNTKKPEKPKKEEKQAAKAEVSAKPTIATGKPARFVRIEIPGDKKCLQIAEIEILSGGKNIAKGGKATQSTTGHGGDASRAMDGDKSPNYGKGMTHTIENKPNPWWEIDLGAAQPVDAISLWSRRGFPDRLGDFTLQLLDEGRKAVFELKNVAAGDSLTMDVKGGGKIAYLDFDGKPGKPAAKGGGGRSAPAAAKEPALVEVPADYKDTLPFAFSKGDTVAILGNGLPDRMQHDGWMETVLQNALPEQNVRFRNMSASGDRPNSFPRSGGHMHMTDYLRHVKPDVVFAFFGYNESFENKPDDFKKQLVDFVKYVRGTKPNGKTFPRIVLFSPIAHEDTKNPNVPSGAEHNPQLEAYTKATEAAAKEAGVGFVDLFHPSLDLFKAAKEPLTINGVHLSAEGNRQLADVIAKALLAKEVVASASLEELREAVMEKDVHWNARYRARDGNDVWGGRSTLSFTDGQTNAVVLQHELTMLDVMTGNRDAKVWARSKGGDLKVDDSNVPAPVPVISNVGGKSKSSSAMKEGRTEYISGQEAIKHMAFDPRFEVSLFADEAQFPQLVNPVQMQVDTKGRLWAAVWHTYPMWEPLKEMKDALVICHDDNKDGKADRLTEFARVQNPLGFEFWNGGVIVTCAPDIIFLKDTDGDDVADVRTIMLQGVDFADTHHGANNLVMGPDGGIYWQSGVFMVHNHEHPWGPSLQTGSSAMYRFDPRRFTIAKHADNSPNPHGIAFDTWGYHYATDGTGGRAYQVRPEGNGFKMYELLKKEVRPVTASEVVSSTHFPEDMQGDFLICNVIGFLGIKHYDLARDGDKASVWGEPAGAELTVKVTQADGSVTEDKSRGLLMSGDKNFRPSDAVFGEDGALYIADWHNVIIGHMQHNVRDPNRDNKHGRIYRMTAKGRELQKTVAIDGQPIPALLENLRHPADGVRHRTRVELSERPTAEVIVATKEWMKQFDVTKKEDAHHLLEALWLHQQHNVRDTALLAKLQTSPELHARNAANVVQQLWFNVEASTKGGVIAGEAEEKAQKSGILSDTPDLTTIRIATIRERLMYDVKELNVKVGKKIKLTFANTDVMPHNLLVTKPGKADAVMNAAIVMGAAGFEKGFIPAGDDVLHHTKLLDMSKEETLEFTLPTAGDYPFVCSFPGHGIIMRGVLHAK